VSEKEILDPGMVRRCEGRDSFSFSPFARDDVPTVNILIGQRPVIRDEQAKRLG
jgi:hypothetical protein